MKWWTLGAEVWFRAQRGDRDVERQVREGVRPPVSCGITTWSDECEVREIDGVTVDVCRRAVLDELSFARLAACPGAAVTGFVDTVRAWRVA